MDELLEKILFLVTKANFVIREKLNEGELAQDGWTFYKLNELWVMWYDANPMPCPTQAQIDGIEITALNAKKEADRKIARDDKYSKDLSMKAAYRAERKGNPSLTFSDFLDSLEAEQV